MTRGEERRGERERTGKGETQERERTPGVHVLRAEKNVCKMQRQSMIEKKVQ